jgi:PAB-dependent poly(A)-specific ribonuclease subunit 3
VNLLQAHLQPAPTAAGHGHHARAPPTEDQLWSYLVQLTAALRALHSAGLAARPPALAPSKVLLCGPGRVRLAAAGVGDALAGAPPADAARAQRDDLAALGQLVLALGGAPPGGQLPPSLDHLAAHHSRELCHVVAGLLAAREGGGFASWRALAAALADRPLAELDAAAVRCDVLGNELQKECENGRLARLLVKLGMVVERPGLGGDERWAETGDRYLLKLFRDFVFHQVDARGAPVVDWGAAVEALNKADAGVAEKVLLLSRDGASMLVVSYEDVRRCVQTAYGELSAAAARGAAEAAAEAEGA